MKSLALFGILALMLGDISVAAAQEDAVAACTQHLQTIGRALAAYQHDNGELPRHLSDLYPKYVADRAVFHCPADHGDALNTQVKTCWEGWGNSYLVEWAGDAFRVKQVTGDAKAARGIMWSALNRSPL